MTPTTPSTVSSNTEVQRVGRQLFTFFKLPDVVLKLVLDKVPPNMLLTLAMCSRETISVLQALSNNYGAQLCQIVLIPNHHTIEFKSQAWTEGTRWVIKQISERPEDGDWQHRYFKGVFFIVSASADSNEIFCGNIADGLVAAVQHGLSIFNVPIKLTIRPGVQNLEMILSTPCFAHCEELVLANEYFDDDEVELIFSKVQSVNKLKVPGYTSQRIEQIFTAKEVELMNGAFLKTADLLRLSQCETFSVETHNLNLRDIEEFLLGWLNRPDAPPQKRFVFHWPTGERGGLDRLPKKNWDRTMRSKSCWVNRVDGEVYDLSEAVDIERADGLLGSLGYFFDGPRIYLIFNVWHDRFPTRASEITLRARIDDWYMKLPEINRKFGVGRVEEAQMLNRNISTSEFKQLLSNANYERLLADRDDDTLGDWFNTLQIILSLRLDLDEIV